MRISPRDLWIYCSPIGSVVSTHCIALQSSELRCTVPPCPAPTPPQVFPVRREHNSFQVKSVFFLWIRELGTRLLPIKNNTGQEDKSRSKTTELTCSCDCDDDWLLVRHFLSCYMWGFCKFIFERGSQHMTILERLGSTSPCSTST